VEVSAISGAGLPDLFTRGTARGPRCPYPTGAPVRLWVDARQHRGSGTVVTGTLAGRDGHRPAGTAAHPVVRPARIRGLEYMNEPVPRSRVGARVAWSTCAASGGLRGRGMALVEVAAADTDTGDRTCGLSAP